MRLSRAMALVGLVSSILALTPGPILATGCVFQLGFATLHGMIPSIVGDCLADEHHNGINGDGLQETTNGLMVWRKSDNWTAFTNGYRTWINGPFGLESRLNSQRFLWENEFFSNKEVPVSSGEQAACGAVPVGSRGPISYACFQISAHQAELTLQQNGSAGRPAGLNDYLVAACDRAAFDAATALQPIVAPGVSSTAVAQSYAASLRGSAPASVDPLVEQWTTQLIQGCQQDARQDGNGAPYCYQWAAQQLALHPQSATASLMTSAARSFYETCLHQ